MGLARDEIVDQLIPHDPGHDDQEWFLGLAQAGDLQGALREAQAVVEQDSLGPTDSSGRFRWFAYGELLLAEGRYEQALPIFEAVLKAADPRSIWTHAFRSAKRAALAGVGRRPPAPVRSHPSRYHGFVADCWGAVQLAATGEPERARAWLADLPRIGRPTSELRWRIRIAERLVERFARC